MSRIPLSLQQNLTRRRLWPEALCGQQIHSTGNPPLCKPASADQLCQLGYLRFWTMEPIHPWWFGTRTALRGACIWNCLLGNRDKLRSHVHFRILQRYLLFEDPKLVQNLCVVAHFSSNSLLEKQMNIMSIDPWRKTCQVPKFITQNTVSHILIYLVSFPFIIHNWTATSNIWLSFPHTKIWISPHHERDEITDQDTDKTLVST